MTRILIALTVVVVGGCCAEPDHRQCIERSTMTCSSIGVPLEWPSICDTLDARADRISRLVADSARQWWVIAPCGDTLWGHGSMPDSMGAGMNPDSSYEVARQHLLEIIDWNDKRYAYPWNCPCDSTGAGR